MKYLLHTQVEEVSTLSDIQNYCIISGDSQKNKDNTFQKISVSFWGFKFCGHPKFFCNVMLLNKWPSTLNIVDISSLLVSAPCKINKKQAAYVLLYISSDDFIFTGFFWEFCWKFLCLYRAPNSLRNPSLIRFFCFFFTS